MSTKGRSTPRVVCCAIPIARAAGKVLVITSRKRPNYWVCEYFFFSILHCFGVFLQDYCADSALRSSPRPSPSSTQRRLGIHGRCTRGCCFERGLGRRSNPLSLYVSHPILTYPSPPVPLVVPPSYSWRAWHDYALRDDHPICRVHVPLLRARRRKS